MPHPVLAGRTPSTPSLRGLLLVALVLVAALARLLPHPPNLTPVGALALFGGAACASRRGAWLLPLGALLVSDLALELLAGTGLHALMPVTYGCTALSVAMGRGLRGRIAFGTVAGASLSSAVLFFVVTNFAVWTGGGLYPRTPEGLEQCYVAAVPFFGNSLAGYALYVPLLFGGLAWLERRLPGLSQPAQLGARDC